MLRTHRHTYRALVIASSGLLLAGSFGVATAASTGRPAVDAGTATAATPRHQRLRHAVAMPFFSFRRRA